LLKDKEKEILPCTRRGGVETSDRWIKRKLRSYRIDRKDLPSAGAGEVANIGIAPAIRNAIMDATGKALNNLPMLPNGMLA
jgi:hypothetical protein